MDIASCLQSFENSLSSYTGGDPLDPWDKFVGYLEQRGAADNSGMSQVLETLVQRFLNMERYNNDIRYVKYCITYAGLSTDPLKVFNHLSSKGVGSRTAALYVAWAHLLEQSGAKELAEAVFHRAMESQAQPEDTILTEYRQFQVRTKSHVSTLYPLQNSQRTNQMVSHSEPPNKGPVEAPPKSAAGAAPKEVIFISRSETSEWIRSRQTNFTVTVSGYQTEALLCDGSELSFEEVRAMKYLKAPPEASAEQPMERAVDWTAEQFIWQNQDQKLYLKNLLGMFNQDLQAGSSSLPPPSQRFSTVEPAVTITHQPSGLLGPSNPPSSGASSSSSSSSSSTRRPLGLRLHTEPLPLVGADSRPSVLADRSGLSLVQHEAPPPSWMPLYDGAAVGGGPAQLCPTMQQHQEMGQPPEAEERLNMSQGTNLSHHTPNTSLGLVQATPSRVLPSPTVNTREALNVIMDMFQAPAQFNDTLTNTSLLYSHRETEPSHTQPSTTPFTVFQDHADQGNICAPAAPPAPAARLPSEGWRPIRGLSVSCATSKSRQSTPPADLPPDETAVWGSRCTMLDACPNSTSDFAMSAHFVSTPFALKTPSGVSHVFTDKENAGASGCGGADDEVFTKWPLKKLSPIMEQSPLDETAVSQLVRPSNAQGTIVGESLAAARSCLTTSNSSSCSTLVQAPPPAVLSFRDPTVSTGWDVYTGPEAPPAPLAETLNMSHRQPLAVMEEQLAAVAAPDGTLGLEWMNIGSPAKLAVADLDVFLSPRPLKTERDIPMSPERWPISTDVPMSPMDTAAMMSPKRPYVTEVSMNASPAKTPGDNLTSDLQPSPLTSNPQQGPLISDPWDDQLIMELLSAVTPPLTDQPHCVTWQCSVPTISPKTTISMGSASLRVDAILGQGAFATVFQATDPVTSTKTVLKVQKPANPWEFYIHTQLDARLEPRLRQLYARVNSVHLFHNGSVLLGELHNYGTLLNAINISRTLSEKVLTPPLVMFLAACVLHTVEQLHAVGIVHADIKPDNFMLGERFLEDKDLDPDGVDHGLVLIDLGQSIDMRLFPAGTAFTACCHTSGFQCTEMLSGKPWSYQTDYFGIAATVHCMLFGTYMQVVKEDGVWKSNGMFRRNPHSDLWADFFHTLLNVPNCSSMPDLRGLRAKLTAVLRRDYAGKLPALKSRLLVQLLENHRATSRQHSL